MAKKKTKSKNRYQAWLANDYSIGWLLFWFIVALALAFWIFHTYQVHSQYRKFLRAETVLTEIGKEIKSTIPSARVAPVEFLCDHQNEKFASGRLYCGVNLRITYDTSRNVSAQSVNGSITKMMQREERVKNYKFTYGLDNDKIMHWSYDLGDFQDCTAVFTNESDEFSAELGCTEFAKAQYFPLRD